MFKGMTKRERLMIAIGGFFAVATFLWLGVYEPAVERRETLKRKIDSKEKELSEVTALAENYLQIKNNLDRFEASLSTHAEGFSLLAEIESHASAAGVRDNVTSMSPLPPVAIEGYTENPIEIKMEDTSLPKLIRFLEFARGSENILRVKRISIKPDYEDQSRLDASITIAGYEVAR